MKLTPEWISGFVDGGGSFNIPQPTQGKQLGFRFTCSQDKRSVDVLYALKKYFSCGTVQKAGGNTLEYVMYNPQHLQEKCIPFFTKYPLQTEKKHSFYKWAHSLQTYMVDRGEECARGALVAMQGPLHGKTVSFPPMALTGGCPLHAAAVDHQLSAGWFRGIVDAQGFFSVQPRGNTFQPRFVLGVHKDPQLMDQVRLLIKCGSRSSGKDGLEMLRVSGLEDLEKKLFPFFETRGSAVLLRTYKRIAFQKFRRIVRIVAEGRHLTPAGQERCRKLYLGMNKINEITEGAFHRSPDAHA